jgi:predicted transcriptional regulator
MRQSEQAIRYPDGSLSSMVDFISSSIGREIRTRRKASGISQTTLAHVAKVRTETVSRIENGYPNPTLDTIKRLLRAVEKLGA